MVPPDDKSVDADHTPLTPDSDYQWTPEVSPSGPLTIIVSRNDGQILVMRNGKEIDHARAALRAIIVPGTTVLITEAPIASETTGPQLTVLDSDADK